MPYFLAKSVSVTLIVVSIWVVTVIIKNVVCGITKGTSLWKDDVLKFSFNLKNKMVFHRIRVNQFKLRRLSEVEEESTPEMDALLDKITNDVNFLESRKPPEKSASELAEAVTEDDVTMTSLIFDKIDEMIILETQHRLFPLAVTGENIDVRNYGEFVSDVATAVHDGLNPGVYKTITTFTPEYINRYIVKKASVVVLTTMTDLNKQLPPPT